MPRIVFLEEASKLELQVRLYDDDGNLIPEFVRDWATGDTLERPDLEVTWGVTAPLELDSIGPNHHRALLIARKSFGRIGVDEIEVTASAAGKEATATVFILPQVGQQGDQILLPGDSVATVALIDAAKHKKSLLDFGPQDQAIEDSVVAAVGRAQLELEGAGNLTLLLRDRRPFAEEVGWTGDVEVEGDEQRLSDTVYVAAWIAAQGLSSSRLQFMLDQAKRDVAVANSVLDEARTGVTLELLPDHPVVLPDFSTYESLYTAVGYGEIPDDLKALLISNYEYCANRMYFPAPPDGPDFGYHVVHSLYVQNGAFRGFACWHNQGVGATAYLFGSYFLPTTFAHELGHLLRLKHYKGRPVAKRLPWGLEATNVMWDYPNPTIGANSTHLTLGQAAAATLNERSFVWAAKRPPDYIEPVRSDFEVPVMELPDVTLELVDDPIPEVQGP